MFRVAVLTLFIIIPALGFAQNVVQGKRFVPGEVIVRLKNVKDTNGAISQKGTSDQVAKFASKMNAFKGGMIHKAQFSGLNMHNYKAQDSKTSVEEMVQELSQMPEVEYVEPNYIFEKMETGVTTQAYSWSQVSSFAPGTFSLTSAPIQMSASWSQVTSMGSAVVVAVIDTGMDYNHSAFANAVWSNPNEIASNGIDDDHNGYVDDTRGWNFAYNSNNPYDDDGHGTHVSGIILGTTQDIFSAPPANPKIRLMPLKFLDSTGSGSTSSAISAIYYAVNNGAKVLNNSWGGGGYSRALEEAIAYAYDRDSVFVAAAGNSSNNNDLSPMYPASYGVYNLISVAATNDYDQLASFSNFGASSVHLSSPGVSILSTYPGNLFAYMSGTSMATPFVSGIVALMRHESPTMNSYQIRNLTLSSTDKIVSLNGKVSTQGRINSLSAVTAAKTTAVSSEKPGYSIVPNGQDRELASAIASRGGAGCGAIELVSKMNQGKPGNGLKTGVVALALILIPVFFVMVFRQREKNPAQRRKFERYQIQSQVTFKVGDREFVGAVNTIGLGGSDLNTQALLNEGSVLTLTISSPDGTQSVQVQGNVVWSQQNKRYGIEFKNVAESVKSQISEWTKSLSKAST